MPKTEINFDHNVFFEFEKKHSLFNLKYGDIFYWDIIRHDIYLELLWKYSAIKHTKKKLSPKQIFLYMRIFFNFFDFLFFRRPKYIFFTASRNRINGDKVYDQNLGNILEKLSDDSILIENFESNKNIWYYKNTFFNPIFIFRKIGFMVKKNNDFSFLLKLLIEEFPDFNLDNKRLNNLLKAFQIEYSYYNLILKIKKPKAIFITQYGVQKGLFSAAKNNNIPVVEVQHGIIDQGHLLYNYSSDNGVSKSHYYLPDYFLSFTKFWTLNVFLPVKKVIAIGNSIFAKAAVSTNDMESNGLLVASSIIFGHELLGLIVLFAEENVDIPIYFKLHTDQFMEVNYYKDKLSAYKNVHVFTNEKSILELLKFSKAILTIQSTAIYEGLHSNKLAVIYKKQSYRRHEHIFDYKNVYLIDNEKELALSFNKKIESNSLPPDLFFKKFDEKAFLELMMELDNEFVK